MNNQRDLDRHRPYQIVLTLEFESAPASARSLARELREHVGWFLSFSGKRNTRFLHTEVVEREPEPKVEATK